MILTISTLSGRFISMYLPNDGTLIALSAVQEVLFGCWRRTD